MSGSRLETFKLTVLFPLLKLNVFFNHTQLVNNFNLCNLVVTYLFNSLFQTTPLLFVSASPGLVYYTIYHSLPTLQSFLYWIYSLMDFQIIIKYQHTYLLK